MSRRRFEAQRPHRFFEIEVEGTQLNVREGRVDSAGKEEIIVCLTRAGARETAEEMIAERLARGFQEAGAARPTGESPSEKTKKRARWRRPRCFVAPADKNGTVSVFFEIWLEDSSLKSREGTVGETARTKTQSFEGRRFARTAAEEQVAAKLAAGFREVRGDMFENHRLQWLLSHRGELKPFFQRVKGAAPGASHIQDDVFGILKRREDGTGWDGEADLALFNGRVPIRIEAGSSGPSERQQQVYKNFRNRQVGLRDAVREALYTYYQGVCAARREALGRLADMKAPTLHSDEQIWPLVESRGVVVPEQRRGDVLDLEWTCTWDDEAGLSLRFRDWTVQHCERR
jgi:predicted DNA-binding WGR domain protein